MGPANLICTVDIILPSILLLKFPAFPHATIRNNALIKEFCLGFLGMGQKVTKSLSSAA
jgi:hypothetical protein